MDLETAIIQQICRNRQDFQLKRIFLLNMLKKYVIYSTKSFNMPAVKCGVGIQKQKWRTGSVVRYFSSFDLYRNVLTLFVSFFINLVTLFLFIAFFFLFCLFPLHFLFSPLSFFLELLLFSPFFFCFFFIFWSLKNYQYFIEVGKLWNEPLELTPSAIKKL